MAWVDQPASAYYQVAKGQLTVGGLGISTIVERHETPLFVYDAGVLEKKWSLLRENLPKVFSITYSVKANPNPYFLKYFLTKGSGLEIASGGELHLALKAGCSPENIFFAGPGKTEKELKLALSLDIGEIHVESKLELERVRRLSRCLGRCARVAVRVNPDSSVQGGAMRMGGKAAPFGIDEELVGGVLDQIASDEMIDFRGLHFYLGTQILDWAVLARQYREALKLASRCAQRMKRPLWTVDFGGGLGIPYFASERPLDMEKLGNELQLLTAEVRNQPEFAGTRFIIEPGRYLVGEAGIYVVQVNDIKVSRGKKFVIVNGGMNHHLAASGNLGQVIKRNFPVGVLNRINDSAQEPVDIVGPLCTPLDVLARNVKLPETKVGDLIGVFQSGAYARAASPLGFLSHPTPAEVLIANNKIHLIRRRGTFDDLLTDIL